MRCWWSAALADVTKLLVIREVSDPDKKASEIIERCRHWDEQFVRSLELLKYSMTNEGDDDGNKESN
jgi:hypothetical protein